MHQPLSAQVWIDEVAAKAQWQADPKLRHEMFENFQNYLAYLRGQARGCFRASAQGYECLTAPRERAPSSVR